MFKARAFERGLFLFAAENAPLPGNEKCRSALNIFMSGHVPPLIDEFNYIFDLDIFFDGEFR